MSSAAFRTEACVLGAGVIGLATARALAMAGKEVLLLERKDTFGSGTSSRNSEVIHAGIYYPTGSLKAKFCHKGKHMLYDYCKEKNIPHRKLGKLIVATNEKQLSEDIPRIMKHASENGVNDLKILSGDDVRTSFEPEVTCKGAIFSPSTGIIDSHVYMLSLLADAEEYGATLATNSSVENVTIGPGGDIAIWSEGTQIICDILVNCAGLYADRIARMVCNDTSQPRQYFAKGNYYRLEGQKTPFRHLVYPVPEKGGLGVHATIDLVGSTKFGPDVEWISVEKQNPEDIDLTVDPKRSDLFYEEVRKYWPFLKDHGLQPDYAGIRPKMGHPDVEGTSIKADFIMQKARGSSTLINLMGIESPGLTSSLAIADEIVEKLA